MPRRSALRLTKRSVDALPCANKDTVFRDRNLAGFGVPVLPSGRKVFRFCIELLRIEVVCPKISKHIYVTI